MKNRNSKKNIEWKKFWSVILKNKIENFFKSIKNILKKEISWKKVWLNALFTLFFPLIIFTIPITIGNNIDMGKSIYEKLSKGILFTTSFSILATIFSTYLDNSRKKIDENSFTIKNLEKANNGIFICVVFVIISASYYGQSLTDNLNKIGIIIELILYVAVLFLYGYLDTQISNAEEITFNDRDNYNSNENTEIDNQSTKIENGNIKDDINDKDI